jgi:hypothetical protein
VVFPSIELQGPLGAEAAYAVDSETITTPPERRA